MSQKIYKIAILGKHASGKGTQAEMLSKKYNIPYVSTGNIFRKEIKNNSDLGKQAKSFVNSSRLVPDGLTNKIVTRRLKEKDVKRGFILDGYPRNINQARVLDKITKLTDVLNIWISDEEVISRLTGRRVCIECGTIYHIKFKPPKIGGRCDQCQGKLFLRDDDKEEKVLKRLKVYYEQTAPLIDYYKKKGILIHINGKQPIPKVSEEVIRKLKIKNKK